jgi:predicted Zn-dependent peptidase
LPHLAPIINTTTIKEFSVKASLYNQPAAVPKQLPSVLINTASVIKQPSFNRLDSVSFSKQAKAKPTVSWKKVDNESYKSRFFNGQVETYQFSNGLKAILLPDKRLPIVSMGIVVKAGAGEETEENAGIFHYLEHLMVVGSNKKLGSGKKIARKIADMGASLNAFTGIDQTTYHIQNIPKKQTQQALTLLSDLLTQSDFTEAEVTRERTTILNEMRGDQDELTERVGKKLKELIFGENHPYSKEVIGSHQSIRNISLKALNDIYNTYYGPKNQVVVINGDFDKDAILEQIATDLGKQENKAKARTVNTPFTPHPNIDELWVERNDEVTQFNTGSISLGPLRDDKAYKKELIALKLLTLITAGGKGSRADKKIIGPKLAEMVLFNIAPSHHQAFIATDFSCKAENYDKVSEAFNSIINDIADNSVTDEELKTAKASIFSRLIRIPQYHEQRFSLLLTGANFKMKADEKPEEDYKILNELTASDIQDVAKKYMVNRQHQKFSFIAPKGHPIPKGPNVISYKDEDLIKENFTHTSKTIQFAGKLSKNDHSQVLTNGMEVVTRSMPDAPIFAIDIQLPGGRQYANHLEQATDGKTQAKISILNHLFDEGFGDYTDDKLYQFVKEYGISGDISISDTTTHIYASAPAKHKDKVLKLIKAAITQGPTITPKKLEEFSKRKKRTVELHKQLSDKYEQGIAMRKRFYPSESNPRGFGIERLIKHVDTINKDDLAELWPKLIVTQDAVASLVGDVTPEESKEITESLFKNTETKKLPKLGAPTREPITKDVTLTIASPNQQQVSSIKRFRLPSEKDLTNDNAALIVLTGILNGIHGRLFEATRIDREQGLLYSIGASASFGTGDGAFKFALSTEPDNAKTVLATIDSVIQDIIKTPPSKEEINRVIQQQKVGKILANQGTTNIADYLTSHRADKTDSLEETLEKLESVTPEQVQQVAKKYLTKPSLLLVSASKENLSKAGFKHQRSKATTGSSEGK